MTEPTGRVSLRLAEFAVTNFRTFRERTVIPLSSEGVADALVVFHGENGAGKSNALAALDLFFRAFTHWLGWRARLAPDASSELPCSWDEPHGSKKFVPRRRDWPPESREPMLLEVQFGDQSVYGTYRVTLAPAGSEVFVKAEELLGGHALDIGSDESKNLKNLLENPDGPQSRPLFILDEHRRGSWRHDDSYEKESIGTLTPLLAERLLSLRLSLEPIDRKRWKSFVALLGRFPSFQGKEVSVDRVDRDAVPEIFFEDPGRQILRLEELSSGEQQLATLCAAILTSRASIVAIAEPEMSLSAKNQELLRDILKEQLQAGLIDQVILESHVYTFDGPEVVRFGREKGVTWVKREPRLQGEEEVALRAQSAGAQKQYVTAEGITTLPESMRRDLGLETGGRIWFLKDDRRRWSAWKTEELDSLFGFDDGPPDNS